MSGVADDDREGASESLLLEDALAGEKPPVGGAGGDGAGAHAGGAPTHMAPGRWCTNVTFETRDWLKGSLGSFGPHLGDTALGFSLFSLRIFVTPLWTLPFFVPVLSPVYHQGHVWAREVRRILAREGP